MDAPYRAKLPALVPRVTNRANRQAERAWIATVPTPIVAIPAAIAIASMARVSVAPLAIREEILKIPVPSIEDARSSVGSAWSHFQLTSLLSLSRRSASRNA